MARLPSSQSASTLDSRYLLAHEGEPTDADLTFVGRIPFGHEVLMHGGMPGVEYCWVLPENLNRMTSLKPTEGSEHRWNFCSFRWQITVEGPRGTVRGLLLLARGEPIRTAAPQSGRRKWYCDNEIYVRTGIENPAHQRLAGQVEAIAENPSTDPRPATVKSGSRYVQAEAR